MFEFGSAIDVVTFVLALGVPALTAYVARTKGQRALVPLAAAVALGLVREGSIDAEALSAIVELFTVQLGAYLGGWKPLARINDRAGKVKG